MTTVLVTGGAGFIGSNLVKALVKDSNIEVLVIDDLSNGRREAVDKKAIFHKGSICDRVFLDKIFKKYKPEYVFHLAALPRVSFSVAEPALTTYVNIYGTVNLLEKSRDYKVKRFIYSSSSSVYGGARKLPTKEKDNLPKPVSPYALEKYMGESFAQMFSKLYGLDTVCLRYFNVYGPGQYGDSPYSTVVSAWLEGLYFPGRKELFLEGDGRQTRDFCYVDNVVEVNIRAMKTKKFLGGECFNIAHGERTSLMEVKKLIEEMTGRRLKLEKRKRRVGDVRDTWADISKARKMLGYNPKISFEEGLKRTVEWHKERAK